MASKRPSAADTIFPPKKRALYEHMKLHGIDKYSTNEIAANGIIHYQDNLSMCGMKLPVNMEIAQSENYSRRRSDSLHSHVSSNSDNTETGSSGSRETSPCTIQSMFDHQTPERNPITSLDGLKSDISKPLFPPSDSDSSMVDSEGHLSPDNSMTDKQNNKTLDKCVRESVTSSKDINIPEKHVNTFLDNESRKFELLKNTTIPSDVMHEAVENGENHTMVKQKHSEIYMGPMVSLLNRFNAEAAGNVGLKVKEQYSPDGMRSIVQSKPSVSHGAIINSAQSVPYIPKSVQSETLTEKMPRENRSCHICNKEFTSRANLHNHMKTHENKSIPCWVCKEKFQSAENLNAHMKVEHKGENPYKCEHCSREFTQFNNLRRHMRVHREKVFKCNLCNREFNEEFYLKMHMGTHTGKRVYSCGVCGAGFPSSHDLKMHVKTHSPSLLHTCDVCGKSFSKACVLRQHKKGHSGERPHKCDKCEKTFIHRHHLTMHMKSHVDEKRLSCNICQKEFSQFSHLYKHLRAHEDMKKYGIDLDSAQKMKNDEFDNVKKKDISKGHQIGLKSVTEVADRDSRPLNEFEKSDKHSRRRGSIGNGEIQKQRRRSASQDSQHQNTGGAAGKLDTGIVHMPLTVSSSSNKYPLPSVSQTFTHQMVRHPSMQYSQDVSHNYMNCSPSRPFSPLFNPLLRSRVPAPLHGYQPYNQLYRNYSDQMHMYYNNIYMMQYMAQNAMLHKGHVEGQTVHNNQENFPQKENESEIEKKSSEYKEIERFETEQKFDDTDRDEAVQSDSDESSELDVVTATNEHDHEKPGENSGYEEKIVVTGKQGYVNSEEHEIAQELLKMSAGKDQIRVFQEEHSLNKAKEDKESERNKMPAKDVDMKNDDRHVNVVNFNDIIERTIRNSNLLTKNTTHTSESPAMKANSFTSFDNVAKLQGELSVTIPKSTNQSFMTINQKSVQGEAVICAESEVTGVNRNSESQTSPLQKLQMFVTSEDNDFNKVETVLDKPEGVLNANDYLTEEVPKVKSSYNDPERKLENECLETGENFVKLFKEKKEAKKGKKVSSEAASVEDSLEIRLEKFRQFADIGMKFGQAITERIENKMVDKEINEGNIDKGSLEVTSYDRTDIENNKDIEESVEKVGNENDGGILESGNNMEGDENVCEVRVNDEGKTADLVPGYFDDSLEDRQLEIVENDSFRGENTEVPIGDDVGEDNNVDIDGLEQKNGNKGTKESKGLNHSNEGFAFTENEFLKHISEINDTSVVNKNDGVKVVEDINERNGEEANIADEEKKDGFVQVTSWEENSDMNYNARNGDNSSHHLRVLSTDRSQLKEEYIAENEAENGAIDLRTERKINDRETSIVNVVQNVASQENLPIDLSLSRRWINNSVNEIVRECKNDPKNDINDESRSPALLSCGLCRKRFTSVMELQSHQIEHAKDIGYHCSICKKSFTGAFELQCHMLKHRKSQSPVQNQVSSYNNNNLNSVEKSVLDFSQQNDSLNRFEKEVKENQEIKQSELSQINKIDEKQYCCKFCDKNFMQEEQLTEHISVHNGSKKPYTCNICRRAFVHRHNLNRHKMSHNSKAFKCDICHRSFKEYFYLQMHLKTHDEENYHVCQICGESVQKSEIWLHTNKHLGKVTENPTYEQIGNRVKEILHEQNMNIDGAVGKRDMEIQQLRSENGDDLRKIKLDKFITGDRALNLRKENVENLNISKATRTDVKHVNVFQNKENSMKAALVLPENSDQGSLRYSGSSNYQMFECHICKNVLRTKHELENHMGIHSGLRPFVCNQCGRAFKKSKGLKTHEKIHLETSFKE